MAEIRPDPITPTDQSGSEDEVRRKPASLQPPDMPPTSTEPAAEEDSGYYDILVIGRSGMGKSSTVDKLMVPNTQDPTRQRTKFERRSQEDKGGRHTQCLQWSGTEDSSSEDDEVEEDGHRVNAQYENLTNLVLSDDEGEYDASVHRIKNIAFCRSLHNSHWEIDRLRNDENNEKIYASSQSCQLLMNDESKVRALDMPGFYSPQHVYGATNTKDSNLAIVRHVVRIQAIAGLRFRRVMYFLPQTGPLKRGDRTLQAEIKEMVKFFGQTIFKRMVLIGTAPTHTSEDPDMSPEKKFPSRFLKQSRKFFQETLVREFTERKEETEGLPEPPIIFIAMTDSCEEILEKVRTAPVECSDSLELVFNSNTCSLCSMEIAIKNKDQLACEYRVPGDNPWANAIPYNESKCHPLMIQRVTGRSLALGFLGLFRFRWCFTEEQCANVECKKSPGSRGCMKVNSVYEEVGYYPVTVRHTDKVDDKNRQRIPRDTGTAIQ